MLASAPESCEELTSGTSYLPPPAFGRFKLLHQIGAGVLGPVFRTHDPDYERLVAVKAFTLDLTPEQASALAAEFERLAGLDFEAPCVAGPLAAGVEDFVPYVAVPYVPGESLDAAIRQYGPAPVGDAIRLIGHVADALDAAAHFGVFHGSLHPRDIIVTPGETHVTGIGVAQALERVGLHGPIRRPYVAPEREGGDGWGAAADIYSLAAIAYEVLTGRRALPGTDQPLPALADVHVHGAAALREAIESALDPDPGRRPACARDFALAITAALSDSAAPGERVADRRPRKPRAKPPKLPGLDEPLQPPENAGRGRARAGAPVAAMPETAEDALAPAGVPQPEAEATPGPGAATADIRYVPVTDPADAGEASEDLEPIAAPPAEAALESSPGPAVEAALPAAFGPAGAVLTAGPTPDLRLAYELLPRGGGAGENVDAGLAADLDRLSSALVAGPTPAVLGIDIFGQGTAARSVFGGTAGADARFDPAAETQLTRHTDDYAESPVPEAGSAESGASRQASDGLALDFAALEKPAASPAESADAELDLGAVDASLPPGFLIAPPTEPSEQPSNEAAAAPPEPLRPFVRGRGAERRRTPSRLGRTDTPQQEAGGSGEQDAVVVPRVFEPTTPTPASRRVPDFELLTRPAVYRPPVLPVIAGIAGGLIIGLAAGYWLGSRSAPPASAPPAQAVTSGRPAPAAAAPAGAPAPAATAAPEAAEPARPAPSVPPPASAESTSRPPSPAAAVRGTIRVTASQQANVDLDGERKGMTPRNLSNVPLGSHTVRVTRPGYAPQEQTVVLTAEEPSAGLQFTLRPGGGAAASGTAQAPAVKSVLTVLIESTPPGARIRIDGRDLGPTPLMVRQLRPGTHTLELRMPGYKPWSSRLTVAAGDRRQVAATLERDNTR
jgi:hypothetical protein